MTLPTFIIATISIISVWFLYVFIFLYLSHKILKIEKNVINIFQQKISKIPALIEVMRPYVIDHDKTFSLITNLHSESIISEYSSIPVILEQNARINDQYKFLMRLSMAIPELQKNSYFIYIREYVMSYDRFMKTDLPEYNRLVKHWNWFIRIKNWTIIGYPLPWVERLEV